MQNEEVQKSNKNSTQQVVSGLTIQAFEHSAHLNGEVHERCGNDTNTVVSYKSRFRK